MLLILDLDDTLIDTSGSLRPRKLRDAYAALVNGGFGPTPSYERLLELDQLSPDIQTTFARFVAEGDKGPEWTARALAAYYGPLPADQPIPLLEGVRDLLTELHGRIRLVLVTLGEVEQQWEKVRRSGLPLELFDRVEVIAEGPKGGVYRAMADLFGAAPSEVVVCGDKVEVDLKPAKELGYTTVHMRWGHAGLREEGGRYVDWAVKTPTELLKWITSNSLK